MLFHSCKFSFYYFCPVPERISSWSAVDCQSGVLFSVALWWHRLTARSPLNNRSITTNGNRQKVVFSFCAFSLNSVKYLWTFWWKPDLLWEDGVVWKLSASFCLSAFGWVWTPLPCNKDSPLIISVLKVVFEEVSYPLIRRCSVSRPQTWLMGLHRPPPPPPASTSLHQPRLLHLSSCLSLFMTEVCRSMKQVLHRLQTLVKNHQKQLTNVGETSRFGRLEIIPVIWVSYSFWANWLHVRTSRKSEMKLFFCVFELVVELLGVWRSHCPAFYWNSAAFTCLVTLDQAGLGLNAMIPRACRCGNLV